MTYTIKDSKSKEPRINKTIRLSKEEYLEIMQKATIYCGGNLSKWIRYASKNCIPFKQDLEKK